MQDRQSKGSKSVTNQCFASCKLNSFSIQEYSIDYFQSLCYSIQANLVISHVADSTAVATAPLALGLGSLKVTVGAEV